MLRRILFRLSVPLRQLIRSEVNHVLSRNLRDIRAVRQQNATLSTVEYIETHLRNVDSVDSKSALLTSALREADVSEARLICEFGVFSGETINHIASQTMLTVYGFDSFQGLPDRWRDGFPKGYFAVNRLPVVRQNVELVVGWFHESLPEFLKKHTQDVAFVHIDCDLYSSAKTVLDLLKDRIKPGCVIVFDEYFNYPGWQEGEYKAFQEFLRNTSLGCEYISYNHIHEQVAVKIRAR